ncbi:hypothetical protein SKAU_G00132860 [Synaphobranchus kaupii]|uniref:Uncharacterized protein n=1 Tax=Synaphobranchus kaupii TaxID=118154 RepID=A0A9Q1FRG6_SYNKA|nr:hypothetical protein SKAU_G00132860 [Synaphobranchus kaupii]
MLKAGLELKILHAENKALSRSNERLNSEEHDLCHDLKRAIGALEECTSSLDESELSQAAGTSSLSRGKARELPASRPGHQARVSVTSSLHDSFKEGEYSVSEDEAEYYGNNSHDSQREKRRRGLPHPHFVEEEYKSVSPPRRRSDMWRRNSTSPFSRKSSVSHRDSASQSRSRADTYRGTYSDRRGSTLSPSRRNKYGEQACMRATWFGEESSSSGSYESNKLRSWGSRHYDSPCFKHLDSIAKDTEWFDPDPTRRHKAGAS